MEAHRHVSPDAPTVIRSSRWRTWVRTWVLEKTLRSVPKTERVLDLCCGYGFYFSINPAAAGIDGDPNCVAELQRQGRNVQLGNVLERLPYADGQFSHVLAHDVLEHFVEDELVRMFSEVHRILEPGGRFMIWVPNRKGYDAGVDPAVGHRLFITHEVVRRLAGRAFRIERAFAEPLPRSLGERFSHNKEVFELRRV